MAKSLLKICGNNLHISESIEENDDEEEDKEQITFGKDSSENMNKLCWFSRFNDLHIRDSVKETIDYEEDK